MAALSDCVYFVDEVLLKSLHSMARYTEVEKQGLLIKAAIVSRL